MSSHLDGHDDFDMTYGDARTRVAAMTPEQMADVVDTVVDKWSPLRKVALDGVLRHARATSPVPPSEKRLWTAFLAGFEASGEGWNGEYGGPTAPQSPGGGAELRSDFDKWLTRPEAGDS